MKYYELDKEEQELLEAVENGEFVSAKDLEKAKREAVQIAKNTLNKTKNINIRLTQRDLHRLKAKAAEEGIPYQTLAASTIHKAVSR
jgi:predicted DNA binding CopG/RHH family protein